MYDGWQPWLHKCNCMQVVSTKERKTQDLFIHSIRSKALP